MSDFHTHVDEQGALVKCYHRTTRLLLSGEFWVTSTLGFPLEHWLWEHTPLLHITKWLGLS